ncbi:hypothetical protein AAFF_G00341520 [Aldrovandia affinis]|uniref:Uncharacterized protein n=1 Tax=Aldrovandia affinis TaxID=143900 RepID=A0AAD7SKQ7_9TELE|nr:hypothetical protein AAFF_G00341520 [Aldrovandia affinis]
MPHRIHHCASNHSHCCQGGQARSRTSAHADREKPRGAEPNMDALPESCAAKAGQIPPPENFKRSSLAAFHSQSIAIVQRAGELCNLPGFRPLSLPPPRASGPRPGAGDELSPTPPCPARPRISCLPNQRLAPRGRLSAPCLLPRHRALFLSAGRPEAQPSERGGGAGRGATTFAAARPPTPPPCTFGRPSRQEANPVTTRTFLHLGL